MKTLISEDWWAVILGMVVLGLVYLQLLTKVPW